MLFETTVFLVLIAACFADVYMHNPKGSNNRLNEQNAVRNNGNRMFDSQVKKLQQSILFVALKKKKHTHTHAQI